MSLTLALSGVLAQHIDAPLLVCFLKFARGEKAGTASLRPRGWGDCHLWEISRNWTHRPRHSTCRNRQRVAVIPDSAKPRSTEDKPVLAGNSCRALELDQRTVLEVFRSIGRSRRVSDRVER